MKTDVSELLKNGSFVSLGDGASREEIVARLGVPKNHAAQRGSYAELLSYCDVEFRLKNNRTEGIAVNVPPSDRISFEEVLLFLEENSISWRHADFASEDIELWAESGVAMLFRGGCLVRAVYDVWVRGKFRNT